MQLHQLHHLLIIVGFGCASAKHPLLFQAAESRAKRAEQGLSSAQEELLGSVSDGVCSALQFQHEIHYLTTESLEAGWDLLLPIPLRVLLFLLVELLPQRPAPVVQCT